MHSQYTESAHKSLSSQSQTRNPTTNKKVIFYTPVQKQSQKRYHTAEMNHTRNVSFDNKKQKKKTRSFNNSMYQLKAKKQQCIRSSRYNQAKQLNKTIEYVQRKRAKTQIKQLLSQHKSQKKAIKRAHIKQIQKFQQTWQNYFIGLRAREQMAIINFRKVQQRDIRYVQDELVEKCKTLKLSNGELKSLQKIEKKMRKFERIDELIEIKKEKKRLVIIYHDSKKSRLLQQQHEKIYSWAKRQEQCLKTYHTKKYNALINRIEQLHNDKFRHYQKQGLRLKMKYHNVLKKLDHEQKMQLNQLMQMYPCAKEVSKARSLTVGI